MTTVHATVARLLWASVLLFGCSGGRARESTETLQQASRICPTGYANCNGIKKDHCETFLMTNVSNCGACGNTCSFANASPACVNGTCVIGSCNAGWADCDGNRANGCETNLASDANQCGACGNVCAFANASPTCSGGACGIAACSAGFANCDGAVSNGCEANLATDMANCGGCHNACAPANASGVCTAGTCQVATCKAGFADCDGNASNGCEVDLSLDIANCGSCGHACDAANGAGRCQWGACVVTGCNAGFADCDGSFANGCETGIAADANNCGGCGHVCSATNAGSTCSAGVCGLGTCNVGYGNCDGDASNGCEADFSSDPNNCSGCGNACALASATSRCSAGACAIAECVPGHADCDAVATNGCEVDTTSDPANCGTCGHGCPSNACAASTCSNTCAVGRADCDANPANGCEVDITSDDNNCGACGELCAPGLSCGAGTCH